MSFLFTDAVLRRLCLLGSVPVPTAEMVFFGLRGCLPVAEDDQEFGATKRVATIDTDHSHPRCTIGQWRPADGALAVYPGSTVPHRHNIQKALATEGRGTNMLTTGFYTDYRKGSHKPGTDTAHEAFRQTQGRPIRRSADDLDYENDDRVEFQNPFDNLHAAWSMGTSHPGFASAGCQVVVGFPKCKKRGNAPESGPWAAFRSAAYAMAQDRFAYLLLPGRFAEQVASAPDQKLPMRLRFGSKGDLVTTLQASLKGAGFYEGAVDADFGERTMRAVLSFQRSRFGADQADGVVGPQTATALELAWPSA